MATTATKPAKAASKTAQKAPPPEVVDNVEDSEAPAKKKKKASLGKLLLISLPLLIAAGGGAWYFLGREAPEEPAKRAGAKAPAAKPVSNKPPVFVNLEPFTVNLQAEDSGAQYLQVGLTLKATDETLTEAVKVHMPEIRNRVLLLLSRKRASEINTLEGKKFLSNALTKAIAETLGGSPAAKSLDSVLFTSFVIQ